MTQGGGRAQPINFTANDYCTGIHLAVGTVLALLARARGAAVTSVDASLMTTATVFQSEHVAQIAIDGKRSDAVGADLHGPAPGRRLYEVADGWIVVCAVTAEQLTALGVALGLSEISAPAIAQAVAAMRAAGTRARSSPRIGCRPRSACIPARSPTTSRWSAGVS